MHAALVDANLADEGWAMHGAPAGFQLIRTIKRTGALTESTSNGGAERGGSPMLQLIFSDGMTYVSLFIEPVTQHSQRQNMLMSLAGATQVLMVQRDAWLITVMGDVPAISLKMFLTSVHRLN